MLPESTLGFAHAVIDNAKGASCTLACAESCTGGLVGAALTSVPGSSSVFLGGVVSYANEVKRDALGVPIEVLEEDGAVSAVCAALMAVGALEGIGSDRAVSVTGIAGPGGGSEEKPVGTVWFALAVRDIPEVVCVRIEVGEPKERARIRAVSTLAALTLLDPEYDGSELDDEAERLGVTIGPTD